MEQKIKDKKTGDIYTVIHGKILTDPSYVLKHLITASFIDVIDDNNVVRQLVFGYDINGLPSGANSVELIQGDDNDRQSTSVS